MQMFGGNKRRREAWMEEMEKEFEMNPNKYNSDDKSNDKGSPVELSILLWPGIAQLLSATRCHGGHVVSILLLTLFLVVDMAVLDQYIRLACTSHCWFGQHGAFKLCIITVSCFGTAFYLWAAVICGARTLCWFQCNFAPGFMSWCNCVWQWWAYNH